MATSLLPKVIFLEALVGLPSRKELLIESPRARCIKKFADELLATSQKEDTEIQAKFATELCTVLESAIEFSAPSTMTKLREQLWIHYAGLINNTLPPLWNQFSESINCSVHTGQPLLMELINESIVDYLIKKAFPVLEVPRVTQSVELSKDEENILRYACGYIKAKVFKD